MNEAINKLTMELFINNPIFWIIIVLGVLSAIFYKKLVGKAGEFWVKKELSKLDKQIYLMNQWQGIEAHGIYKDKLT